MTEQSEALRQAEYRKMPGNKCWEAYVDYRWDKCNVKENTPADGAYGVWCGAYGSLGVAVMSKPEDSYELVDHPAWKHYVDLCFDSVLGLGRVNDDSVCWLAFKTAWEVRDVKEGPEPERRIGQPEKHPQPIHTCRMCGVDIMTFSKCVREVGGSYLCIPCATKQINEPKPKTDDDPNDEWVLEPGLVDLTKQEAKPRTDPKELALIKCVECSNRFSRDRAKVGTDGKLRCFACAAPPIKPTDIPVVVEPDAKCDTCGASVSETDPLIRIMGRTFCRNCMPEFDPAATSPVVCANCEKPLDGDGVFRMDLKENWCHPCMSKWMDEKRKRRDHQAAYDALPDTAAEYVAEKKERLKDIEGKLCLKCGADVSTGFVSDGGLCSICDSFTCKTAEKTK